MALQVAQHLASTRQPKRRGYPTKKLTKTENKSNASTTAGQIVNTQNIGEDACKSITNYETTIDKKEDDKGSVNRDANVNQDNKIGQPVKESSKPETGSDVPKKRANKLGKPRTLPTKQPPRACKK
ncbi:hypothetical protein ACJJTC_013825 [Scirpophaga incertulas]